MTDIVITRIYTLAEQETMMARPVELSVVGGLLLEQATSLRERAFCRLLLGLHANSSVFFIHWREDYAVHITTCSLKGLMSATHDNFAARARLDGIPICNPGTYVSPHQDPELTPALQDLAELIAWEAEDAVSAKYYPRMPEVNVPADHVKVVMAALQREMDRESMSRRKTPPIYAEMPWERQCALAERRRYWYGQYGITPERWATGTWSLWEVAEIEMPQK